MSDTTYILVRRAPLGSVMAHDIPFDTVDDAGRAVTTILLGQPSVTKEAAVNYARELTGLPLGTIVKHSTGYEFRILAADYTADGKLIHPGLRVLNTDMKAGAVSRSQFMRLAPFAPGGEFFEGWYDVAVDGVGKKSFNGERLTTDFSRFGKTDVPRETSLILGEGW